MMSFEAIRTCVLFANEQDLDPDNDLLGRILKTAGLALSLALFISFYFDVDHTAQNSSPDSSWSGENRQANTLTITSACVVEQRQVKMANLSGRAFIHNIY